MSRAWVVGIGCFDDPIELAKSWKSGIAMSAMWNRAVPPPKFISIASGVIGTVQKSPFGMMPGS